MNLTRKVLKIGGQVQDCRCSQCSKMGVLVDALIQANRIISTSVDIEPKKPLHP